MSDKVTVEYYADPLQAQLIGAVDVPANRRMETAQSIGKAICKALDLTAMDAVMIDGDGNIAGKIVVRR